MPVKSLLKCVILSAVLFISLPNISVADTKILWSEDFSGGLSGDMTTVSVSSNNDWFVEKYGGNFFAKCSGYGADTASDDWLITPPINLRVNRNVTISADTMYNYDGPEIEVLFSIDYDPDIHTNPHDANWINLNAALPSTGNYTPANTGELSLEPPFGSDPALLEKTYVAFHYISTGPQNSEGRIWQVDNIRIQSTNVEIQFITIKEDMIDVMQTTSFMLPQKNGKLRVTAFNASFFHYEKGGLIENLSDSNDAQAAKAIDIIQSDNPDIILINEFDFDTDILNDPNLAIDPNVSAVKLFQEKYLGVHRQTDEDKIKFPYAFAVQSNTRIPAGMNLNNNGQADTTDNAHSNKNFPRQYVMAVFSKYPVDLEQIRSLQMFFWNDTPDTNRPENSNTPSQPN